MNFHGSTRKKRTGRRVVIALILLLLALNIFDVLWPHTAVRSLLMPVRVVRQWVTAPIGYLTRAFADKDALVTENQMLKAKITELEVRSLQQQVHQSMYTAFSAEQSYGTQGTVVPVLVRPPYTPYDTLVLDVRGQSVVQGSQVFVHDVVIGEVTQVDSLTAVVTLFTSPGTKTLVRIASVDAEAVGHGGGRYVITVPKDVSVEAGAVVVAPRAFNAVLGVAGAIDPDAAGTFQDIHVSLPVAFSALEAVTVVPPSPMVE